ncbi:hypothetical protein MHYP_G00211300 [Metynnis hypsauchen]
MSRESEAPLLDQQLFSAGGQNDRGFEGRYLVSQLWLLRERWWLVVKLSCARKARAERCEVPLSPRCSLTLVLSHPASSMELIGPICSWYTEEESAGLSVPLICKDKASLLFKH